MNAFNLAISPEADALRTKLISFMEERILPSESIYREQLAALGDPHGHPQILLDLKQEARELGLWNLFLPHKTGWTDGLSNLDYAPLAEITASSVRAGALQLLRTRHWEYGDPDNVWHSRATEHVVASAVGGHDPIGFRDDGAGRGFVGRNEHRMQHRRDGDEYVINGRKWWISGSADPRCRILIVMGKTDPSADRHRQQSMVLVPIDTPGVTIVRNLPCLWLRRSGGTLRDYLRRRTGASPTFSATTVMVSQLRRPGSVPDVSTTACEQSASQSVHWS